MVYESKVNWSQSVVCISDIFLRKQAGAASLQTAAVSLKLSDSARDLAYEEMKAMAAALDEEPQAEGEAEEETGWIGNNLQLSILQ